MGASAAEPLVPTEQLNPRTRDIDLLGTTALLGRLNDEDALVAGAVRRAIPQIAVVVEKIVEAFAGQGHLIYFGAGTSGRLGVLDASECPPTYGTPPEQVQAYIAGGDHALRHAVEKAEDNHAQGAADFNQAVWQPGDVVVGISASGNAPYVLGAIEAARAAGCFTACITANAQSQLAQAVEQAIVVETGAEAIAGSTRMKAGTAQKLVLNMLTTGALIQSGKTYENWMVDVRPTNAKLVERAHRIVANLAGVSAQEAQRVLEITGYQVKPAVVMLVSGVSAEEAQARLAACSGKLRLALQPYLSTEAAGIDCDSAPTLPSPGGKN